MRVRLQREVDVEAPARAVWDYVTDWPRHEEWVPLTRVERIDAAAGVGGRFRAWTGLGPLGFWDPMTITAWERSADGGGRWEVLHLGPVVKGEAEFVVLARGPQASRFVWTERIDVPLGVVGAAGWRVADPVVERGLDRGLRRMGRLVEEQAKKSTRGSEPA